MFSGKENKRLNLKRERNILLDSSYFIVNAQLWPFLLFKLKLESRYIKLLENPRKNGSAVRSRLLRGNGYN